MNHFLLARNQTRSPSPPERVVSRVLDGWFKVERTCDHKKKISTAKNNDFMCGWCRSFASMPLLGLPDFEVEFDFPCRFFFFLPFPPSFQTASYFCLPSLPKLKKIINIFSTLLLILSFVLSVLIYTTSIKIQLKF